MLEGVMKSVFGAVAAISGAFAASWAAASPLSASDIDLGLGSVAVQFERQELASPAGIARVYQRLRQAAHEVCSPYESIVVARQRAFDRCVSLSLARAVADAHHPGLTAYTEQRLTDHSALDALGGRLSAADR
jgi:UrcA family protein